MEKLQGKKVIVTGGAMGIGLATCRRLVREDCDVTIWDLSEKDLIAAVKELTAMGGKIGINAAEAFDQYDYVDFTGNSPKFLNIHKKK